MGVAAGVGVPGLQEVVIGITANLQRKEFLGRSVTGEGSTEILGGSLGQREAQLRPFGCFRHCQALLHVFFIDPVCLRMIWGETILHVERAWGGKLLEAAASKFAAKTCRQARQDGTQVIPSLKNAPRTALTRNPTMSKQ